MRSECKPLDDARSELQPLKRLYVFTVQKRDDGANNEDQWYESPDGMICAVSDGASVSFDSGPWAAILVRRFTRDPNVSREWIQAAIAEYSAAHDREAMPWMQQAAFDRGSFATLLGVWFLPNWQGVRVFSIGDTILAFIDGGQVVRSIPYVQPDEFDQSPQLLSTNPVENRSLDDEAISQAWQELNIASHDAPTLLLMTDALGRWLLDQPDSQRVSALLDVRDKQAFRDFVDRERAKGRLRRDDTTLVVIGVSCELSAEH
jgi:hypothetical protein